MRLGCALCNTKQILLREYCTNTTHRILFKYCSENTVQILYREFFTNTAQCALNILFWGTGASTSRTGLFVLSTGVSQNPGSGCIRYVCLFDMLGVCCTELLDRYSCVKKSCEKVLYYTGVKLFTNILMCVVRDVL